MNPVAHRNEDNARAPVLYMALELSNKSWRLAFGDGTKRRQRLVPAADLVELAEVVQKTHGSRPTPRPSGRGSTRGVRTSVTACS